MTYKTTELDSCHRHKRSFYLIPLWLAPASISILWLVPETEACIVGALVYHFPINSGRTSSGFLNGLSKKYFTYVNS